MVISAPSGSAFNVEVPERFSNLQWYLSHAGNTVQMVAFLERQMTRADFVALVENCLSYLPELALGEDRSGERFFLPPKTCGEGEIWRYETVDELSPDPTDAFSPATDLFDRNDLPAFRATCQVVSDASDGAPATRLHFTASHSLVEGADLAAVLRGRLNRRGRRSVTGNGLSRATRFGLAVAAPFLACIHVAMAKAERRKPTDFGFACVEMERADIEDAARTLNISKRGLLFALALFTLAGPEPRRRAWRFAYSKLPARRILLEDDDYLSVRVQAMASKGSDSFADFARMLDRQLAIQNETEVLTHFLANRVLKVQRRVAAVFPGLYRGAFFGFSPYDMVLSLVPPIAPAGPFAVLAGARILGGSYTGTVPGVIYLCDAQRVSWTCWLERRQADRLQDLAQLADSLNIRHTIWAQPLRQPQDRR